MIMHMSCGAPGAGWPRRPGNGMLTSKIQARDGAGLTGATGVPHRGHEYGAASSDPGFQTADRADTPAVSRAAARAQSSRAHVLRSHKALTS
jgi:hypothetical protein